MRGMLWSKNPELMAKHIIRKTMDDMERGISIWVARRNGQWQEELERLELEKLERLMDFDI